MNNWMTHLAREVAGWLQRMSQEETMGNLPFDGMGSAKEIKVLGESV